MAKATRLSPAEETILIEKYEPMVRRVAQSLRTMKPSVLEPQDVLQDGMIGLLRAIRTNRAETSDAQFAAFAGIAIRGAIIDGYRAAGDISRGEYDSAKRTRQAISDGLTVSSAEKSNSERLLSLAWSPRVDITDSAGEGGTVADPEPGPEQRAIANQLLRLAIDSLQRLPVRDRTIFICCELQGEKHARIAELFGLSGGRVSQILKSVRREVLLAIA
jgi:RNA polymerase sigma factor for flagellar operon FliA